LIEQNAFMHLLYELKRITRILDKTNTEVFYKSKQICSDFS